MGLCVIAAAVAVAMTATAVVAAAAAVDRLMAAAAAAACLHTMSHSSTRSSTYRPRTCRVCTISAIVFITRLK